MVKRLAAMALVAGCSIPAKTAEPDLLCRDQVLPMMAAATVSLGGHLLDATGATGLPGVTLRPHVGSQTLNPTMSDTDGSFFYTHDTGGVPRTEYLDATLAGFLDLRFYPSVPVAATLENLELHMLTSSDASTYATTAGVALDPAKGVIMVRVVDCNRSPLIGGTISTSPRGPDVRYFADGAPSASAMTTDDSGLALIANVSAGAVTVTGSYEGTSLRSHDVTVSANAVVETALQP